MRGKEMLKCSTKPKNRLIPLLVGIAAVGVSAAASFEARGDVYRDNMAMLSQLETAVDSVCDEAIYGLDQVKLTAAVSFIYMNARAMEKAKALIPGAGVPSVSPLVLRSLQGIALGGASYYAACNLSKDVLLALQAWFYWANDRAMQVILKEDEAALCARIRSISPAYRHSALPSWCPDNGASNIPPSNRIYMRIRSDAPSAGVLVYEDEFLSRGAGYVGPNIRVARALTKRLSNGVVVMNVTLLGGALRESRGDKKVWIRSGDLVLE